ncbi:hypothetical protein BLNAU_5410 [Blattamonas nauphoetae]|uniref:Uncharacterized protein n=1 Tax=Blattamonas nauphoetae TaxID=2049346 RepID=A0ABQ9Y7D0_9EUKA|nr:hypothetical protein BLNAU_5410 [Blattamonas nauphoetae]
MSGCLLLVLQINLPPFNHQTLFVQTPPSTSPSRSFFHSECSPTELSHLSPSSPLQSISIQQSVIFHSLPPTISQIRFAPKDCHPPPNPSQQTHHFDFFFSSSPLITPIHIHHSHTSSHSLLVQSRKVQSTATSHQSTEHKKIYRQEQVQQSINTKSEEHTISSSIHPNTSAPLSSTPANWKWPSPDEDPVASVQIQIVHVSSAHTIIPSNHSERPPRLPRLFQSSPSHTIPCPIISVHSSVQTWKIL